MSIPFETAVAKTLIDLDVSNLFGVMGDVNMYIIQRYVAEGGKYVGACNEAGATQMAIGYSSVAGVTGVATCTCGPGYTNTLTSIVEGVKAHHPLVIITGQGRDDRRGFIQIVNQSGFAYAAGAGYERPDCLAETQSSILRAFQRASVELRPIVFELPPYNYYANSALEYRRLHLSRPSPVLAAGDGENWDSALGLIASAKRPLIVVGWGAVREHARDAILRLSKRIGAPVGTTLRAKDWMIGDRSNIGLVGVSCRPETNDVLVSADCIIAFGASLNTYTNASGTYVHGKRVIAFNSMSFDTNRLYIPDVSLQVNSRAAADYIIDKLDEAEIESSGFSDDEVVKRANSAVQKRRVLQRRVLNGPDFLTYDKALQVVDEVLGERILVTEGGRYNYSAWHNIVTRNPENFIPSIGYGAIGIALGQAIGAAVANQSVPVVLVMGDGGFVNAGVTELQTIQNEGLDILIMICNDKAYGTEYRKFKDRGIDPDFTRLDQPDFASVARAFGALGMTVRTVGDLSKFKDALESWGGHGVFLVDVVVDAESVE